MSYRSFVALNDNYGAFGTSAADVRNRLIIRVVISRDRGLVAGEFDHDVAHLRVDVALGRFRTPAAYDEFRAQPFQDRRVLHDRE